MAVLAGATEGVGGLFLVLGFLTPWAAAMVMGTMYVAAVSVHADNGLWATNGGYELPLTNGLVATGLAFTGAGSWSLDHAIGIPWTRGFGTGLLAIVLALVTGIVALGRRRRALERDQETAAYPAEDAAHADADLSG
jgi:putative oxidoreductase